MTAPLVPIEEVSPAIAGIPASLTDLEPHDDKPEGAAPRPTD